MATERWDKCQGMVAKRRRRQRSRAPEGTGNSRHCVRNWRMNRGERIVSARVQFARSRIVIAVTGCRQQVRDNQMAKGT